MVQKQSASKFFFERRIQRHHNLFLLSIFIQVFTEILLMNVLLEWAVLTCNYVISISRCRFDSYPIPSEVQDLSS